MPVDPIAAGVEKAVANLLASSDGNLPEAAAAELFRVLRSEGERLQVAALTTASLALTHPQAPESVKRDLAALLEAAERLLGGANESLPFQPIQALATARETSWARQRQTEAGIATGWAVALLVDPRLEAWQNLLRAFRWSHLGHLQIEEDLRDGWMNWIDDVVRVPNDRVMRGTLAAARRTLEGSLGALPESWELEVSGLEQKNQFALDLVDGPGGRMVRTLGRFSLELVGTTLRVIVHDPGEGLRDPLRVEYVTNELALRRFLARRYEGRFDRVEYTIVPTGETWMRES
ncbi:MAG: hypothetical protein U0230_03285 [Polyangiales bacterium]